MADLEKKQFDIMKYYFEEAIKTDSALAQVYDEAKLKDCMAYVKKQAQKYAINGMAMITEEVVYKWARDFYYGDTTPELDTAANIDEVKKHTLQIAKEIHPQEKKLVISKVEQEEEKPVKQKKEKKVPVYNGPNLFDLDDPEMFE